MKTFSLLNRVLFVSALVLFGIAVVEKVSNATGYTVIGRSYAPGRLIEFAAIMVLFVVALLLREIRDQRADRG
jgi:hypothetical protein